MILKSPFWLNYLKQTLNEQVNQVPNSQGILHQVALQYVKKYYQKIHLLLQGTDKRKTLLFLAYYLPYFIIFLQMQIKNNIQPSKQTQQQSVKQTHKQLQFATKIKQSDEIKLLCKKLDLLKAGLIEERNKKKQFENQFKKNEETIIKCEEENKRKQKKYQSLTAEIKKLKDELIQQRNIKSKLCQQLESKMQISSGKPSQEKKVSLGLFGLRSLFSKDNRIGNI